MQKPSRAGSEHHGGRGPEAATERQLLCAERGYGRADGALWGWQDDPAEPHRGPPGLRTRRSIFEWVWVIFFTTRGPQVLVLVSICQGSVLGTFDPPPNGTGAGRECSGQESPKATSSMMAIPFPRCEAAWDTSPRMTSCTRP